MSAAGSKKQYDHLIKLIIIGDSSVGKSCILLRFSEDHFPTSHMPTIGKSRAVLVLFRSQSSRQTATAKSPTGMNWTEKYEKSRQPRCLFRFDWLSH